MSLHAVSNTDLDFFTPRSIPINVMDDPLTSDAGLLLIRQFDERIGCTQQFADALHDPRDPRRIDHTFLEMTRMRIFGIIAGHEDQNEHITLRTDPVFVTSQSRELSISVSVGRRCSATKIRSVSSTVVHQIVVALVAELTL